MLRSDHFDLFARFLDLVQPWVKWVHGWGRGPRDAIKGSLSKEALRC
jgi:hypothetical protein